MSRAYSDHFNNNSTPGVASGLTDTIPLDTQRRIGAGRGHGRRRVRHARVSIPTAGMTDGDEVRLMQFLSSDRIYEVFMQATGGSTTYAASLGIYLSGARHDGAVLDVDLFGAAIAMAGAIARSDHFETGALSTIDKGKTFWELGTVGALSLTKDPMQDWDLVLTSTATGTGAVEVVSVEVAYTSGD